MSATVLLLDRSPHARRVISRLLDGHEVVEADSYRDAWECIGRRMPDVVIIDAADATFRPIDVVRRISSVAGALPTRVLLRRVRDLELAVESARLGADCYLETDGEDDRFRNELLVALAGVAVGSGGDGDGAGREVRVAASAVSPVGAESSDEPAGAMSPQSTGTSRPAAGNRSGAATPGEAPIHGMVGRSPEMLKIFRLIGKVSRVGTRVLIEGESGTGKELVATAIHEASKRSGRPFVAVNCAAIPGELVESELFGHEKGSFTGASERRIGRFEEANGGTLFLDEIGEMSASTQSKLLRAIETGQVRRVGSREDVPVDVRLVTATNQNLSALVDDGSFRKDLYYRIAVVRITLPPLRDRSEDVPALVAYHVDQLARVNGISAKEVLPDAMQVLTEYEWPGNVRELRNVVERLLVLSDGEHIGVGDIARTLKHLGAEMFDGGGLLPLREARERFETRYIRMALEKFGGVVKDTAAALEIDRSHLWKKMKTLEVGS